MATNSELTARGASAATQQSSGPATGRGQGGEAYIRPPVDIFEDQDGITLRADMPGVSKERLNLRVDGNNLILEGQAKLDLSDRAEALHADVRSSLYRRSFALSSELETDRIEASLKDGVLTVRIPRRAELRPRRIEVQTR